MMTLKTTTHTPSPELLRRTQKALADFMNRKEIGFKDIPERESLWSTSREAGQRIARESSDLVLIGIGGSSLGPQILADLAESPLRVHFADNVDPFQFRQISRRIGDWSRTSFLVISKSGTTLETLVTAELFSVEMKKRGHDFAARTIVVTEPRSNSLADWAAKNKVTQLEIPLDVGGRFSILTPVGLVLAEALGFGLDELRAGAREALRQTELTAQVAAHSLASFERGEWITFLWNYSSGLRYFGLWFQQLWAESLAKAKDRKGQAGPRVSTPLPAVGTCDQHSLLQQVMEGTKDKWVVQIRVKACESEGPIIEPREFSALSWLKPQPLGRVLAAEAEATARAITQAGVSTTVFEIPDLGPKSVGFLLMHWQLVVGCLGESLGIDAFDQPGVEAGKRLAKELLQN